MVGNTIGGALRATLSLGPISMSLGYFNVLLLLRT